MQSVIAKLYVCCWSCYRRKDDTDEKETLYQKRPSLYVTPAPTKDCQLRSHSITSDVDFYVPRKDSDCLSVYSDIDSLQSVHERKGSLPPRMPSDKRLSVGYIAHRRHSDTHSMETIGELKPELYKKRYNCDDMIATSDIIEDYVGSVMFTVQYESSKKRIKLHLQEVFDLPCKGEDKSYDPIAILCMLPAEKNTQTTKIVNNCLQPQFDEHFYFPIPSIDDAYGKSIRISLYDSKAQRKHNAIGHALLEVDNDILVASTMKHCELRLTKESEVMMDRGRLFMSTAYHGDQLILKIGRASGLKAVANSTLYVKACLICGGEKVKTKKGIPVENIPADVEFHQNFDFVLPKKFIDDSALTVTIVQKGRLLYEAAIGRAVLGPFFYSKDQVLTQWGKVMVSMKQVDDWYALTL